MLRPFESKYEYCIFLYELLSFYEKVPSALDHTGVFFEIYYRTAPPPTQMIFFTKGVTKERECLQQNIFDSLRFLDFDSEQVQ